MVVLSNENQTVTIFLNDCMRDEYYKNITYLYLKAAHTDNRAKAEYIRSFE